MPDPSARTTTWPSSSWASSRALPSNSKVILRGRSPAYSARTHTSLLILVFSGSEDLGLFMQELHELFDHLDRLALEDPSRLPLRRRAPPDHLGPGGAPPGLLERQSEIAKRPLGDRRPLRPHDAGE